MATTFNLPSETVEERVGLEAWMERALDKVEIVGEDWNSDGVHDLRTTLRRCRTMADALNEVNPDSGWHKLKKESADLFHTLGALRDTQVEQNWVKQLGQAKDPIRKHLLKQLAQQEKKHRKAAKRALDEFDPKRWKKLLKKLRDKARFFPPESVVFQRLALVKLNEAVALYQKARKTRSAVALHTLRKGIKRFRYIVENFLPQRYEVWSADLKHLQDLLGEVHDLDVLRREIVRRKAELAQPCVPVWRNKIRDARKLRLDEFRMETSKRDSLWLMWRAGFRWAHTLQLARAPEPRSAYSAS
ncbi:MAG: CHAD domain-containing protein [Candidatus Acidiferrales bacterium]